MEIVTKKINLKSGINYHLYRMFLFLSIYELGINKHLRDNFTLNQNSDEVFTIENDEITLYFKLDTLELYRRYMWVNSSARTGWYYRRIEKFEREIVSMNKHFLKLGLNPWKFKDEFILPLVNNRHVFANVYATDSYTFDYKYCDASLVFGNNIYVSIDEDGINVIAPKFGRVIQKEVQQLLKEYFQWK